MPHDIALKSGLSILASSLFGALCMAGILGLATHLLGFPPSDDQQAAQHNPSLLVLLYAGGLFLIVASGLICGWRTYCHERDKPR